MDYFRGTHTTARKLSDIYSQDAEAKFRNHTPDRWLALKLTEITQGVVASRHREITAGTTGKARGGSRTANYWLAIISKLFELGITQGQCTANPAKGIKRNDEVHRERYLIAAIASPRGSPWAAPRSWKLPRN